MRGIKTAAVTAAFGVLSICTVATSANAGQGGAGTSNGPVTEAGETIGLALGAALPEGVFFVDTASVVHNPGSGALSGKTLDVLVNIPVVAWSTPWNILGGHVEAYAAAPEAVVDSSGLGSNKPFGGSAGMYNPALLVGAAWNLGNNFHFSNFVGGYAPVSQPGFAYANATNNVWTFNERAALTYLADGYNLTVHAIYGTSTSTSDVTQTNSAGVSCARTSCTRADYLNVDFTALKSFGKWDFGPVAYYAGDVGRSSDGIKENSQFALGGYAGYNFGPITVASFITHDVAVSNHLLGGEDTRFFLRFVVPLWVAGAK